MFNMAQAMVGISGLMRISAVLMCALQAFLLLKTKKWRIRLIPVYILIAGAVLAFLYRNQFFGYSGGYIDSGRVMALLIVLFLAYMASGAIAGRAVRLVISFIRKNKKE